MTKAVIMVLASSGLGSTTCLSYYLAESYTVHAFGVDYGQPAALAGKQAIDQIARH